MELRELCCGANIQCPAYEGSIDITSVISDSREVRVGCLFVCIRGLNYDGHDFIREALRAGASAIVTEEGAHIECDGAAFLKITVPKCRQSLACLLDTWYGSPSKKMKFVAVTGTNGKTSVTCILKSIFETAGYKCGLIGTISCLSRNRRLFSDKRDEFSNMTTPDPDDLYRMLSEMVTDGVEYVFIEASSHALELDRLSPISFSCGIFTNLTVDHLDFHGNMEKYLSAKQKLFTVSDIAVINADSDYYNSIVESCTGRITSCSVNRADARYCVTELKNQGTDGFLYTLVYDNNRIHISTKLSGEFNIMNILEATACALELGVPAITVKAAIENFKGVPGRLEKIDIPYDDCSIYIDYAHTPDALENLLLAVNKIKKDNQRIVLLFGCGGNRDKSKRPIMGEIATRLADFVVITSDNCRNESKSSIISQIIEGIGDRKNYIIFEDRKKAIENTVANIQKNDIIILAGKGHEKYEINNFGRVPFDERKIVEDAIKHRYLNDRK